LNTAPAKAWVRVGKTSETTRRPTVKRTSTLSGDSSCAKNASYQYGQCGLMTAISNGEAAQRVLDIKMAHRAGTLSTIMPVVRLTQAPRTTLGSSRIEVLNAEWPWTSWKLWSGIVNSRFASIFLRGRLTTDL